MQEQSRLARPMVKIYNIVWDIILKGGWVNPSCLLRGSYRTNFGFVLASRKQGLAPVSEGDPIVFGWDKKNPRLKYTPAGPLLKDTTTFRMTSNGFLVISNHCEIKISVVSSARESGAKRRDFSCVLFLYRIIKMKRFDCRCGQIIVFYPITSILSQQNKKKRMSYHTK